MTSEILQAIIQALHADTPNRFMRSERGYHGRFYCALQRHLDERNILKYGIILEMEYQKSSRQHMKQRPDIILHVPSEEHGTGVDTNNYCVIAIKRRATPNAANEDFVKLDQMCHLLRYPLAVFINIDSTQHHLNRYTGRFGNCLHAFAVTRREGVLQIIHASLEGGVVIERRE